MKPKRIFNTASNERYEDAKIIGGNPNGIINYERTPHKWAYQIYKNMEARTWFPRRIDISQDKIRYHKLSPEQKRAYDLVLAQLITNDSIQTNQLVDKINSYITSPVVNAAIVRQAQEETIHAEAYSVMAEDICEATEKIFNMHNEDEELALKNKSVENMYLSLYDDNTEPTDEDILLAFVANQILEELVFPGGFAVMLSMSNIMTGSANMIQEIMKDETNSHVVLFKNIFRTTINERFNSVVPTDVVDRAMASILEVSNAERRWTKYVAKNLAGFSDEIIDIFINSRVNNICKNLWLPFSFKEVPLYENPLGSLLQENLVGSSDVAIKQNHFETSNINYNKTGVVLDF